VTRRWLAAVIAVMILGGTAALLLVLSKREPPPPEPGIPAALADARAARVSQVHYEVAFTVPARRDEPVRGRVLATFTLADASKPLAFDFTQPAEALESVTANGQRVDVAIVNGHILIPAVALTAGSNGVEMVFRAGDAALNRQDELMYTLFVPARASLTMPCFDQPDLKARWQLSLQIPAGWTAVANGREVGRATAASFTSLIFEETPPLPTYLFAFAAGQFVVETGERSGRTFRMLHRETDAAKVARNRDVIFDLHARALGWLEDYTAIPYAFGKFDFVLIPSFQFGGMEHAGAVFYNASGLLLDESATQNQLLGRAMLIAHETAHMWFGDLVTMRWFDDVWMKEVFANFMAAKIVNPSFPAVNHELRFLFQQYPAAYDVDRTEGANPIRQSLANLNEAGSLYGAIIYQKAPIVMRQLERILGGDAFRDGLREYLKAHSMANATWPDLIAILDARTPVDLAAWSRAWVTERGRPLIRTVLEVANGKITRLAFRQEDPLGRRLVWPQRIQVVIDEAPGARAIEIALDTDETALPDAAALPEPRWILPVGGGLGYGGFKLDPATLSFLTTSLAQIPDPLTRGAALVALWEAMLDGDVPPAEVLRAIATALPREADELIVQQMLEYLRQAFWRFTGADERAAVAATIEPMLRAGLASAATTSGKAAWFGAIRNIATTPGTIEWLERVWSRQVPVPGLPLAEPDEADLAFDLAVRDVPQAERILARQLERFLNPDRRARFAFAIPAVSRDPAVRDLFFEGLADVKNRAREAWVLDAMRYLNHPLRAASSRKYIRRSLELVHEIQRTGDIFFPKRWTDAALSGYQAVQTAAEVRAFIDQLPPDYPPRLRWVLLASADPLFRAARIVN
jgi:aminopeptidase N